LYFLEQQRCVPTALRPSLLQVRDERVGSSLIASLGTFREGIGGPVTPDGLLVETQMFGDDAFGLPLAMTVLDLLVEFLSACP
jgi:hypothetical protein